MRFLAEHIGLAARDPVALKDWYLRVLNARLVFASSEQPPAFFLELPGGLFVEIYASQSATAETGTNSLAGWRHLALQVECLEVSRDALTARGVALTEPIKPAGGGGRVLFFRDLDGNLLHLVERPQHSMFRRGTSAETK